MSPFELIKDPKQVSKPSGASVKSPLGALAIGVETKDERNDPDRVEDPLGLKDAIRDVTSRCRRLVQEKGRLLAMNLVHLPGSPEAVPVNASQVLSIKRVEHEHFI
ncbi:MAG: hypothetical protein OXN92_17240 [Gammaproteobacteria bacterium]|nr:hypothetical protein [Gammaproteobacteria bacterium]